MRTCRRLEPPRRGARLRSADCYRALETLHQIKTTHGFVPFSFPTSYHGQRGSVDDGALKFKRTENRIQYGIDYLIRFGLV
ncbi:hypothetical protein GQ55_1G036500 [Panicum hallii var. hallii]|uniref:Uncharacterized protein n=1 Tax=Panicum hallii var. hallii TaxID=1504633 RepID=A0A2T7F1X8_9POAL|nr:hypothetical protein GQ55_1G036500 [Panicum hallii var. hallii]